MSDIDFIVVAKNQFHLTKRCVDSLLATTVRLIHLIVVDNASADETPSYLNELKSQAPPRCEITIIRNSGNQGYGHGLNQGLQHAHAPYVVFCNNDIEFFPGAVDEMIRIADENPKFGLINPNSNEFGLTGYDAAKMEEAKGTWTERCHTSGFCVLVRRGIIEKIGGIDPVFGLAYFEDMDYAERARQAGFLCVVAKGAYVYHAGTRTFLRKEKQALWDRNKEIFNRRWSGGTKWFAYFVSDAECRDRPGLEKVRARALDIVRRETAILHLFVPIGKKGVFAERHDSFRVTETRGIWRAAALLAKVWRSQARKKISRIYVSDKNAYRFWKTIRPLHSAEVFLLEKDAIAS